MSVKVNNMRLEYPDQLLFDGVSLSVSDGELIAIHTQVLDGGTSLLKGIAGFLQGVDGEVWFEGYNLLTDVPEHIQHKVGYVYETNGLVSIYSIFQNIALPLQFHTDLSNEEIVAAVIEMCELFNIPESQYELRPHNLNDVQTRMVNLARALVVKPKLLLIDEIEGGMSEDYLQATMQAIRARQEQYPMAIIITTASELVMHAADRVYSIKDHNLVAIDT